MRREPFVQCRNSDAKIICNLLAQFAHWLADPHCILAKFVRLFQSHNQPPLLQ